MELKRIWKCILADAVDFSQAAKSHASAALLLVRSDMLELEHEAELAAAELERGSSVYLTWWYGAMLADEPDPAGERRSVNAWNANRLRTRCQLFKCLHLLHRYDQGDVAERLERRLSDCLLTDQLIHNYYKSLEGQSWLQKTNAEKLGRGPNKSHPMYAMFDASHSRLCLQASDRLELSR